MTTKERPIIFSGDMVRAIIDGRKTQTRRIVKSDVAVFLEDIVDRECAPVFTRDRRASVQDDGAIARPERYSGVICCVRPEIPDMPTIIGMCPYGQPGDRLWVRESFCEAFSNYEEGGEQTTVYYRADGQEVVVDDGDGYAETNKDGTLKSPWKPSIHMPRWASRITLEITDIRVERLQDISEEDAQAEGAPLELGVLERTILGAKARYRSGFVRLWESINGPGSWDANPWVWCVSFKRVTP